MGVLIVFEAFWSLRCATKVFESPREIDLRRIESREMACADSIRQTDALRIAVR